MSDSKKEETIMKKAQFEQLLFDVSARFINLSSLEVDKVITESLEKISQALRVDSCTLLGFHEELSKKPNFFLMIEGSQIDWAAHANDTDRTIRHTLLFDMAVREAIKFAQLDRHTLVIVTADHETGGLKLAPNKDNGVEAKWTSKKHTAANVPIYAFGPGSEKFSGTLDNTDIPKRIAELTGIEEFPVVHEQKKTGEMVSN